MAHRSPSPRISTAATVALALLGIANIIANPGCIAFYGSRKVTAQVVDGDTLAPIANANIKVDYHSYDLFPPVNSPRTVNVVTDRDGLATLRVSDYVSPIWTVSTPGYIDQELDSAADLMPMHCARTGVDRVRMPLYMPPRPSIVIVVPQRYRGPVAVTINPAPSGPPPTPGMRTLEIAAPPNGIVGGTLPGPFNLVPWPDVRIRLENGTMLAMAHDDLHPDAIRQHRVDVRGRRVLFVVGTDADAAAVTATLRAPGWEDGVFDDLSRDAAFLRYFGETPVATSR